MSKKLTEERLEDAVVDCLTTGGGYVQTVSDEYDPERALNPQRVIQFISTTQPKPWTALSSIHGADTEKVVLDSLCKELELKGSLKVLREGFKCYGRKLKMVHFSPNNEMNPETLKLYNRNELSVTRQLYYSTENRNSLDIVLFVNGLPVATAELKNPMTGQTVEHAKKQYKLDRDPRELLFDFKKRALVHFAVDPELVFMTTRLSGNKTFFLPFNRGCDKGAGNPPAPEDGDILLSELIDKLNDKFGTEFTQADQLFFDQIHEEALASESLQQAASVNNIDDFRFVFNKAFEGLIIDRMEGNEEIFGKLMADAAFRKIASEHLLHQVFHQLNTSP